MSTGHNNVHLALLLEGAPRVVGAMRQLCKQLSMLSLCLVAGVGLCLSIALVGAATPTARLACERCEEANRFVRLQQLSEESCRTSSRHLTHPLELRPQEWASVLLTLQVQRQAEGLLFRDPPSPMLPAFTPDEINYLSTALSEAFAQARPDECVVFGISRLNDVNMTEVTTGGWFADGPSLHLILANYRKVVTMPSTRQLLWERPLRPDAGPHYNLVARQHQTIMREAEALTSLFSSDLSELGIDYRAMLLGELEDSATSQPTHPSLSNGAPPPLSIEEPLRALKRFLEQGLITEDDYRAKKQQLLDQF
ncbi:SHOCT domain-containing protein [Nitrospira sp. BLG_1]|uniref:SHOCT domain-containing protein n=1 Tax=Nitrospira sp. BLG_1 TaxID=3395883 RepID=UPI0039BD7E76